jgi:hypothetical protein
MYTSYGGCDSTALSAGSSYGGCDATALSAESSSVYYADWKKTTHKNNFDSKNVEAWFALFRQLSVYGLLSWQAGRQAGVRAGVQV